MSKVWAPVEIFERDGRMHIVLRETDESRLLTPREVEIAALAAKGSTAKTIALGLGISYSTVRVFLARIVAKLGVRSGEELKSAFTAMRGRGAAPAETRRDDKRKRRSRGLRQPK